jgi:hypothetical protein
MKLRDVEGETSDIGWWLRNIWARSKRDLFESIVPEVTQ